MGAVELCKHPHTHFFLRWKENLFINNRKNLPQYQVPVLPRITHVEHRKLANLLDRNAVRVCVWKQGMGNINRIQNKPAACQDVCSPTIHFTTTKSGLRYS